jgi:hypothetical protein
LAGAFVFFHESLLGVEYEELIGSQSVGVTGHSIAELRAGAVMARWGGSGG